jgi:hypothetical protein
MLQIKGRSQRAEKWANSLAQAQKSVQLLDARSKNWTDQDYFGVDVQPRAGPITRSHSDSQLRLCGFRRARLLYVKA